MILSAYGTFSIVRIIVTGAAAYFAACRIESVWARVFGIAYLCMLAFFTGATAILGDFVSIILFFALTGAAIHAWWYTRV